MPIEYTYNAIVISVLLYSSCSLSRLADDRIDGTDKHTVRGSGGDELYAKAMAGLT